MITPVDSVSAIHVATNAIVIQKALEVQKQTTSDLLDETIKKIDIPEEKSPYVVNVLI
jgi:hypothetical protein